MYICIFLVLCSWKMIDWINWSLFVINWLETISWKTWWQIYHSIHQSYKKGSIERHKSTTFQFWCQVLLFTLLPYNLTLMIFAWHHFPNLLYNSLYQFTIFLSLLSRLLLHFYILHIFQVGRHPLTFWKVL